jgi:hypothetical protein
MEFDSGRITYGIRLSLETIAVEKCMDMNDNLKKTYLYFSSEARGWVCNRAVSDSRADHFMCNL